jgi:CRISPR-associated protein Csd1
MILQALCDLAQREGLGGDFRQETVDLLARIDSDGKLLTLVPTAGEDGRSIKMTVPLRFQRSGKRPPPYFLVDNALYVLGLVDEDGDTQRTSDAIAERTTAFRRFIDEVAGDTRDPGIEAARRFCDQLAANQETARRLLPDYPWNGRWVAFVLDGDDAEAVHMRAQAQAAWQRYRARASKDVAADGTCLITGAYGPIARVHRMPVKNVPGGKIGGTALVSFNAAAFESHGLEQASNAPVSASASEAYVAALNWMLERPAGGGRRYRQGIAVGDSVLAVWTRESVPEITSLLDLLSGDRADPSDIESMVLAPWRGTASDVDVLPFYGLTLSGAQARAFVRGWFETTLGEVKKNIIAWFDALSLAGGDVPMAMWQLIAALDPPGDAKAPPILAARLVTAALFGGPLPREAMRHALARFRAAKEPHRNESHARIALTKAVLMRTYSKEVTVSLNPECRDHAYLLGRLFAVLERLQAAALNDLNATIRDRFFGAASSTPATVFPRLIRLSVHHAAKAEGAGWLEKLKGQVINALPAAPFPSVLDLEQQGLFGVGYYHQRETFFRKRTDEVTSSTGKD